MNLLPTKKFFIFLLTIFLCSFSSSSAEVLNKVSSFKAPILNPTDLAFNGHINAIARDEKTGIVYVGGEFTKVGKIKRNHLAAIGTDGTLLNWNPDVGIIVPSSDKESNSSIHTIKLNGSTVYVGGHFTKVGRIGRNNLAAIGTNGTVQAWNPNVNGTVYDIEINGSTVYIGGHFTKVGRIERSNLAAIGTDSSVNQWNPDVNFNGVSSLVINDSGIYFGGQFTTVQGKERHNLAAVDFNGILQDWNPNVSEILVPTVTTEGVTAEGAVVTEQLNGVVLDLAKKDSIIYVGGYFTTINKESRDSLAAIGSDGTLQDWSPNINQTYPEIRALTISGSKLYVGGQFDSIDNKPRANFASFIIP